MSEIAHIRPADAVDFGLLQPGFADPVRDAQACFRAVLDAMAHPGRTVAMPVALPEPLPLGPAAAAIALALCDIDTPVWLDAASAAASGYLAFHCGAPPAETPATAAFAFVADLGALPLLDTFGLGSDEYPERSTTLVIEVAELSDAGGVSLRGPGIREMARLDAVGLPARFWTERAALAELFPRGLDVLFSCGDALAALPRSTRIVL
jgi:alpha-D-ribose 1-methylphosphonate 5-triphosphate synthase subunit PhnH